MPAFDMRQLMCHDFLEFGLIKLMLLRKVNGFEKREWTLHFRGEHTPLTIYHGMQPFLSDPLNFFDCIKESNGQHGNTQEIYS